VKKKYSEFDGR